MSASSFKTPIAHRQLSLGSATVDVYLDMPEPEKQGRDFSCRFEILGLSQPVSAHAVGIDSIRAIQSALSMIGSILKNSSEAKLGNLKWSGGGNTGDLGF